MTFIKYILSTLLKLAFLVGILICIVYVIAWYFARPINKFCNSIPANSTYEQVLEKTKNHNYRAIDKIKNNNGIVFVETQQDMPMFRMGCKMTFKDGLLIKRQVINTD